jgi:hypothetical protein
VARCSHEGAGAARGPASAAPFPLGLPGELHHDVDQPPAEPLDRAPQRQDRLAGGLELRRVAQQARGDELAPRVLQQGFQAAGALRTGLHDDAQAAPLRLYPHQLREDLVEEAAEEEGRGLARAAVAGSGDAGERCAHVADGELDHRISTSAITPAMSRSRAGGPSRTRTRSGSRRARARRRSGAAPSSRPAASSSTIRLRARRSARAWRASSSARAAAARASFEGGRGCGLCGRGEEGAQELIDGRDAGGIARGQAPQPREDDPLADGVALVREVSGLGVREDRGEGGERGERLDGGLDDERSPRAEIGELLAHLHGLRREGDARVTHDDEARAVRPRDLSGERGEPRAEAAAVGLVTDADRRASPAPGVLQHDVDLGVALGIARDDGHVAEAGEHLGASNDHAPEITAAELRGGGAHAAVELAREERGVVDEAGRAAVLELLEAAGALGEHAARDAGLDAREVAHEALREGEELHVGAGLAEASERLGRAQAREDEALDLDGAERIEGDAPLREAIEVRLEDRALQGEELGALHAREQEDVGIGVVQIGGQAPEAEERLAILRRAQERLDLIEAEDDRQRLGGQPAEAEDDLARRALALGLEVGAEAEPGEHALGQAVAREPRRGVADPPVHHEVLEHDGEVPRQAELRGDLREVGGEGLRICRAEDAQAHDAAARAQVTVVTDLVREEALELGEALISAHEIARQTTAHVLPEELRRRLQAHEHEDAAQDLIGRLARRLREVALHAREQVRLAGARRAVHEQGVRLSAGGRVDPFDAGLEDVAVDVGHVGRRLPGIQHDVVAERIGERSQIVHDGLLGAMPM